MLLKNNLRPIWMNRLFLFEDNEHMCMKNVFDKLEGPAPLPIRLEEFTAEEIENLIQNSFDQCSGCHFQLRPTINCLLNCENIIFAEITSR